MTSKDISDLTLELNFVNMAKRENPPNIDKRKMSGEVVEKWLTKANSSIAAADVGAALQKLNKPVIDFKEFKGLVNDVAKDKGIELNSLRKNLVKVAQPED